MTSPNSTQTGYSLIEVLVAFVILSLTLGIMFRVFSAGLRNIDTAADYTEAVVIAESRLATPGVIEPLVMGQQQGTAAERYSWIRTISPFDSRDRGQLSVQWSKFGAERKVQLSTIRLENKAARK